MSALLVQALMEASHVQRCHAMPTLTDAGLAKHQWGVASLALALCPEPSLSLIRACMWHDVPERWSGDIPGPARREFEELQTGENLVTWSVWHHLGHPAPEDSLSEEEKWWLRFCDMADFYLFSCHEVRMGNSFMMRMKNEVIVILEKMVCFGGQVGGEAALDSILKATQSPRFSDSTSEIR